MRIVGFTLLALFSLTWTACSKHPRFSANPLVPVYIDPESVSSEHRDLLDGDLKTASWVQITDHSQSEVMGLKDFTTPSLATWLGDRVKSIVGEEARIIGRETKSRSYRPETYSQIAGAEKLVLIMMNVSATYYYLGKKESKIYTQYVNEEAKEITTPRLGLLLIGEGLFSKDVRGAEGELDGLASSYRRISTLFHEARHGDGNGDSLIFGHVVCTSGDFVGEQVCDSFTNGAYTAGKIILQKLAAHCSAEDCTDVERAGLDLVIADAASRVNAGATEGDQRPERINQ